MLQTKKYSALQTRRTQAIRSILIATDLSLRCQNAMGYAIEIARRYEATLHVLHVVSSLGYTLCGPEVAEQARQLACQDMDDLKTRLVCGGALKLIRSRFSVRKGDIPLAVEEYARDENVDLIVLGTHCPQGFGRLLLGSVGERISRSTQRPVLSTNPNAVRPVLNTAGFDHILFATDFGAGSILALSYATSIAAQFGATLSMLHVIPPFEPKRAEVERSESPMQVPMQRLRALSDSAGDIEVVNLVETGDVTESILRIAGALCANLIVLGLKRVKNLAIAARYPGSIAHRVLCEARCPVLTITE